MTNLEKYIINLKADKKSAHTIVAYSKDIQQMLEFVAMDETKLTLMDLIAWKESISDMSSATVARKITAVKNYLEFLCDIDIIAKNPAKKLTAPKIKNKEKTPLTSEQVRAMINSCNNKRDKAIVTIYAQSALRVSELINLSIKDIDEDKIIINGKGDKDRVVYLSDETLDVVKDYLKVRKDGIDNLFVSNQGTPMKPECLSRTLKKIAKKCGITDVSNISNHLMRATSATLMAENNVPIQVIQDVLGHAEISTTRLYVKNNLKQVKDAMTMKLF